LINAEIPHGHLFVPCKIEKVADRERSAVLTKLLVDTGSEYTWVPPATLEKIGVRREKKDMEFVMANDPRVICSIWPCDYQIGQTLHG